MQNPTLDTLSDVVERALALDANIVSKNPKRYSKVNSEQYTVLIATWCSLAQDTVGDRGALLLLHAIYRDGLLSVISATSTLASDIIASDFTLSDLGYYGALMSEDPRATLQLLRYPKRFSPELADIVLDEGIASFININRRCRGSAAVIDRDTGAVLKRSITYPRWLIAGVRDYVWCMLDKDMDLSDDQILLHGKFSSGVTANHSSTLFEKILEFSRIAPCFKSPLYAFPLRESYEQPLDYVLAKAVPKTYKAPRIIAEVDAFTQYHMQGIRALAICSLEADGRYGCNIHLDDQSINQELSWLGSVHGTVATIDLSSASDSISESLAEQLLPSNWYSAVSRWNPRSIKLPSGKLIPRNIFLTSGSGDTFVMETIIFLSIALFATEVTSIFTGDDLVAPVAYGDDLICDVRVVDTLYDFLGLLGFTVNKDKSFDSSSRYRESCGAEWWCGLDVSTKFYPRGGLGRKLPERISSLTALQHRLYGFPSADRWLSGYIRAIVAKESPKTGIVTSSVPGSDCTDLWEEYPLFTPVNAPYDHNRGSAPSVKREVHNAVTSVKWSQKAFLKAFRDHYRREPEPEDYRLCEVVRYVDFLQHGPMVDDYGIPQHRDVEDDLLIREIRWGQTIV